MTAFDIKATRIFREGYVKGHAVATSEMLAALPDPVELREIARFFEFQNGRGLWVDLLHLWADRAEEAAKKARGNG